MTLIVPPPASYTPCPAGLHQAVCCDVVDLGIKETKFGPKHKIRFAWQVDLVNADSGTRFDCIRSYTRSLDRRSTLRTHLESWIGRSFTEGELKHGLDLERLIGMNAYLNITHQTTADGRIYANVSAILPPPAGTPSLSIVGYIRHKDRPPMPTSAPVVTLPLPNPAASPAATVIPPLSAFPAPVLLSPPAPVAPPATPANEDPADEDDISFAFGKNVALPGANPF